ncbi:ABC transporter substrate-binding protein [Paenibacillus sp. sgz302251]|uniref:ABC transporter substrate-binding protein n=1 Tax=Paenibacillus sp. sgz302251 TaxID=3414493 RepID=UPI003C7E6B6E
MKKSLLFNLCLFLFLTFSLTACGNTASKPVEEVKEEEQNVETELASTETENEYIEVKHFMGTASIPKNATKVVTLTPHFADHVLSLGVQPIGTVVRGEGDFEPYMAELLNGTENIGQPPSPNLEKILMLKPEVMFGEEKNHVKPFDALNKIAPTIVLPQSDMEGDWRTTFMFVADALGKTDLANEKLAQFDNRVEEVKQDLEKEFKGESILLLKVTDKEYRVLGKNIHVGTLIYDELGMTYPSSLNENELELPIAMEKLPEINPDHIILFEVREKSKEKYEELINNPLWSNLSAVQNENIYVFDDIKAGKAGHGLIMHNLLLDQIESELLGRD